jgi:type IV fimbrial biogenesis protein FimT
MADDMATQTNNQLHKQKAFTLIELLTVISIIAIVTTIALPSFQSLIFTTRISSYTSTLQSALLLTRSEAVKRGINVTICRSENASSGNPSCATTNSNPLANTGWASGWIIFTDPNNNGIYEPGNVPAETLIAVQDQLIQRIEDGSIIPNRTLKFISYGSTGQTFGTFVRFAINRPDADPNIDHDRFICIAAGGRARVDNALCAGN